MKATNLTEEQVNELRERAAREAGPFVDPRLVGGIGIHNGEWASEILGFPFPGARHLPWPKLYLLHLASQTEPNPPPPPLATARQQECEAKNARRRIDAAEAWQRTVEEWEALKAVLATIGVPVTVRHNYTSHRHVDGYSQGADHIWLRTPLAFGRLVREANNVLCYVPSKAKDLDHFPIEGEYDDRVPTCRACLKTARSIAARVTPTEGKGT